MEHPIETFTAIGRFLNQRNLHDVCVLEFERGVILTGTVLGENTAGSYRRVETHVLSREDLARLTKED